MATSTIKMKNKIISQTYSDISWSARAIGAYATQRLMNIPSGFRVESVFVSDIVGGSNKAIINLFLGSTAIYANLYAGVSSAVEGYGFTLNAVVSPI